jgi:hypothetical protein
MSTIHMNILQGIKFLHTEAQYDLMEHKVANLTISMNGTLK